MTDDATTNAARNPRATQPEASPTVVSREEFDAALAEQVTREKEVTRHNDAASASRRRLPMVEVDDYTFAGPDGPIRLSELFGDRYLLMVQNFMFAPDWEDGCPSCTYATDSLPAKMGHFDEAGIAYAQISQAPIEKLQAYRAKRGWPHLWVSSHDTTYHTDWGWTRPYGDDQYGPVPGFSFYLLKDGTPYLTYSTTARGTEAIVQMAHIQDRTVYGRQQDWEDSPAGWPQYPTYG